MKGFTNLVHMSLALNLLLSAGCQSLTPKPPTVKFIGTEFVQKLEMSTFLECTSPESNEMVDRKVQRSAMSRTLYYNDKANRDQPSDLDIPTIFTLSQDAYRRLKEQGEAVLPQFELQIRQRRKMLVAKVYQATTALHDSKDRFVRRSVATETYPRFYDWVWHPECKYVPEKPVQFNVQNLADAAGVVRGGKGSVDQFGRIYFNLRPYIEMGQERPDGLRFSFTCPSEGLHVDVVVPQEVFELF